MPVLNAIGFINELCLGVAGAASLSLWLTEVTVQQQRQWLQQ